MSLNNASLLLGASLSPTGGSALDFVSIGGNSPSSNKLVVPADSDLLTRRSISCVAREHQKSDTHPSGFTQPRESVKILIPKTLANGLVSVDTLFIELSTSVETTVAEKESMMSLGGQVLSDSDFHDFFVNQVNT